MRTVERGFAYPTVDELNDYVQHEVLGSPHLWTITDAAPGTLRLLHFPQFDGKHRGSIKYRSYIRSNFWSTLLRLNWEHEVAALRNRGVVVAIDVLANET